MTFFSQLFFYAMASLAAGAGLAQVLMPPGWSAAVRNSFRTVMIVALFFLLGLFWLTTGRSPIEKLYVMILCPMNPAALMCVAERNSGGTGEAELAPPKLEPVPAPALVAPSAKIAADVPALLNEPCRADWESKRASPNWKDAWEFAHGECSGPRDEAETALSALSAPETISLSGWEAAARAATSMTEVESNVVHFDFENSSCKDGSNGESILAGMQLAFLYYHLVTSFGSTAGMDEVWYSLRTQATESWVVALKSKAVLVVAMKSIDARNVRALVRNMKLTKENRWNVRNFLSELKRFREIAPDAHQSDSIKYFYDTDSVASSQIRSAYKARWGADFDDCLFYSWQKRSLSLPGLSKKNEPGEYTVGYMLDFWWRRRAEGNKQEAAMILDLFIDALTE
jgi:hypothetical protein